MHLFFYGGQQKKKKKNALRCKQSKMLCVKNVDVMADVTFKVIVAIRTQNLFIY